jgi:hypothetical protein
MKKPDELLKPSSWIQEIFNKKASLKPRIILAESRDLVTLSKIGTNTFVSLLKILTRFGSVSKKKHEPIPPLLYIYK